MKIFLVLQSTYIIWVTSDRARVSESRALTQHATPALLTCAHSTPDAPPPAGKLVGIHLPQGRVDACWRSVLDLALLAQPGWHKLSNGRGNDASFLIIPIENEYVSIFNIASKTILMY